MSEEDTTSRFVDFWNPEKSKYAMQIYRMWMEEYKHLLREPTPEELDAFSEIVQEYVNDGEPMREEE